ncbi:MAG: hypothetical protein QOF56_1398, partial [Acidobacteriaceae bacterium]|nr:hypothetical protein [Acidobacteriaceae bacterium]
FVKFGLFPGARALSECVGNEAAETYEKKSAKKEQEENPLRIQQD